MNRKGDYIGTFTGKRFWPLDPKPEDVDLEDVAHALSNICRFNGHTWYFYSVAAHSINVFELLKRHGCDRRTQLLGLLHDAAEAYCCDIPRPLKQFLPGYKEIEIGIMATIYEHFGIAEPTEVEAKAIKWADNYILALEGKQLMKNIEEWNLIATDANFGIRVHTFGTFMEFMTKVQMLLD